MMTPSRLLCAVIAAIIFATAANAEELSPPVYEKKATWAETMIGASDSFAAFRKQLDDLNAKLGLNALRVEPWQWVEGPDLGALPVLDGKPAMETAFPPETMKDIAPFAWGEGVRRTRGPRDPEPPLLADGAERNLPNPPRKDHEFAFFVMRHIETGQPRPLDFWYRSDTGARFFLNGEPITPPLAAVREAQRLTLHLKKGRNMLVAKFALLRPGARCYVSLWPMPGDFRLDRIASDFQSGLRRDFPAATVSFANIYGFNFQEWLAKKDIAAFAARLKERLAAAQGEPYVSCLSGLSAADSSDPKILTLFEDLVKRVRERNALDLPPIAYVKRPNYGMNGTNATMFSHRTGKGSTVCIFDPKSPDKTTTLLDTKQGFVWDLSPSYDATKILMSYKEANDLPFSVYEMNMDGGDLRRLTDGKYHDLNPVYYPDGRIVFSSSRVESFSLCQDFLACALHIMNADGTNLRRFDFTTLCSNAPAVLPDGSIICTRWEYQDKTLFSWQGLWSIAPDGRNLRLYYGNTLTVPNSRYGAKPIPGTPRTESARGTDKVLITMAAHHHPPLGDVAIVDRNLGVENLAGFNQITHGTSYQPSRGRDWQDRNWPPGDVFYPESYTDPMPVDGRRFLVSYSGDRSPMRHRIYLLDYCGIGGPIIEDPQLSCFAPVPLGPRPKPPAIVGEVPTQPGEGTFLCLDVYQGLLGQGVRRGQVKELRVVRVTPKKWNTEGPRFHDHYPIAGYGSYYIKENLGTVPVYEDGSAYFKAPSNCELYFIALDKDGKEVQRMGSVTQITTGERVSCVGCHEGRMTPPPASLASKSWLERAPDAIAPPPWNVFAPSAGRTAGLGGKNTGAGPFDYVKHVQPVFDRYCVKCHEGRNPPARLDLSGDKTRFFNMSYDSLTQRRRFGLAHHPEPVEGLVDYYFINPGPTGVFPALKTGSMASKLTEMIEGKSQKVCPHFPNLDDESRRRIYAWIDSNVQYYATWDMSRPHTVGGRDPWHFCKDNQRVRPEVEPWMARLEKAYTAAGCIACHEKITEDDAGAWTAERFWNSRINLTRPEFSEMLNAHLSKQAGGMGLVGEKNGRKSPIFRDTNDPVYKALLEAIQDGKAALLARPRMDMPGGVAIPQERNFGKVF